MIATLQDTLQTDKEYLRNKFRDPVFDESTGLENETIKSDIQTMAEEMKGLPKPIIKARIFEYITRQVRIDVNPRDWFVGFACWNRKDWFFTPILHQWRDEVFHACSLTTPLRRDLCASGAVAMWPDFDHSVPDWDAVLELGFSGLRERARRYRRGKQTDGTLTETAAAYYEGIEITYTAILEMIERFHAYAMKTADGNPRVLAVADCLKQLRHGVPRNTFEVLEMIYLYFMFGEHIDHMQVRSLSNLDQILQPYYKRDIESGAFTEERIREYIDYFLMQYASINNYWGHPLYLGGTGEDDRSRINDLSYIILEEFDKLNITSPKIQLKIAENTPERFLNVALDMVRRNNSSLVFLGETGIKRAMMSVGFSQEQAREAVISGCYEYNVKAREVGTGPVYLNLLKPLELVFNNGVDPMTGLPVGCRTGDVEILTRFDVFYRAYLQQLSFLLDASFRCVDDFEQYLRDINPANVFSATIENSLKQAKDAFADGSVYNTTAILHTGLATATDALTAVKRWVFEKKELTLMEMKCALEENWQGYEKLRRNILNSKEKYGNNIAEVDHLAEAIARFCANRINLRPNARGGFYKAGMHSARTFITLGEKTGATPDGRKRGEEMSKNVSPSMGMDRNGITALIHSANRIDSAMYPTDYALDVMLHPTTVRGEEGLAALRTVLRTYLAGNGASIHFNIFDADTLRDAQKHPERYESLQVRVCGWNVRFNDLCRKEQEEYIKRAEAVRESTQPEEP
ncbi:MAG: hypothetical protein JXA11_07595 [Phycisphaerae bacterium]|nr:hypothetical protein [Phycisphaerae bacterium]